MDMDERGRFNVASHSGLPGPVHSLWERFSEAGFNDADLPDDKGWMPTAVFSGHFVGRIAIRRALADSVVAKTARSTGYTRAQQNNFMREGRVLDRCKWPVQSIPTIAVGSLDVIAADLVTDKKRRDRKGATDVSSGCVILDVQRTGSRRSPGLVRRRKPSERS